MPQKQSASSSKFFLDGIDRCIETHAHTHPREMDQKGKERASELGVLFTKEREFDLLRQSLRIMNGGNKKNLVQTKEKLLKSQKW